MVYSALARRPIVNQSVIAILPMRAGSQRVMDKNIRKVAGWPLYMHIVNTLKECRMVERVVVNTDIEEVLRCYKHDPFVDLVDRKPELAGNCDMNLVIADTLDKTNGDFFIQVHATSPLVTRDTIDSAVKYFFSHRGLLDSLFSVTRVQKRFWDQDCYPLNHSLDQAPTTQDLSPMFEENSCFYLFSRQSFEENGHRIGKRPGMYEIPPLEAWDIDTEDELLICELVLATNKSSDPRLLPE